MNGRKRYQWIWIAAAALSLSLLAVTLGAVFSPPAGPVREAAETAARPFLRLSAAAAAEGRRLLGYFSSLDALRAENAALQEENVRLTREARLGELAQGENQRLRALLELEERDGGLTLTDAWVMARSPDPWRACVTLDKGSAAGLREGQCVVDAAGALVGRISETGNTWAQVTLLTDPAFSLAAQGSQTELLGALSGRLDRMEQGELIFTPLGSGASAQLGEGILTYAQGGRYPAGLLVGSVTSREEDPAGLQAAAVVTPAADLSSLGQVFVVTAWSAPAADPGEDLP